MKTNKKQNEDYYKLLGLQLLAVQKNKELQDIVLAVAEIVGEKLDENDYGHSADFVYSGNDESVKSFMTKMKKFKS